MRAECSPRDQCWSMKIDDNGRRLAATRNNGKIFINGRLASSRLLRFHSRWDPFVMEMRHNYVSSVAPCTFIFLLARAAAERALYLFFEIRCAFRPRIPHAKTTAFKSERRGKQKGANSEVRISSIVSHPFQRRFKPSLSFQYQAYGQYRASS